VLERPLCIDSSQEQLAAVADYDLRDHTRCNCRKHIVAAYTDPVIATRRLMQSITAIVVDHVLAITVIVRQAVSAMPIARAVATRTAGAAMLRSVIGVHRRAAVVVLLRAGAALRAVILILALILITATAVALHAGTAGTLLRVAVIVGCTVIVGATMVIRTTGPTRPTGCALRERRRCQTQA
jgi:hypothetical protein